MKLLILVGGLGTRLQSVVADRPKCLALIHGRPFIEYLLDKVIVAGFNDVTLCTGFRAGQVEEHLGAKYRELTITYSREEEPLGTGGAIVQAIKGGTDEDLFIMNGDSFTALPLGELQQKYLVSGRVPHMGLVWVEDGSRYGQVELSKKNIGPGGVESGIVTAFLEKGAAVGPGWINSGIYLLPRKTISRLPSKGPSSLEKDLFPQLAAAQVIRGYGWKARFIDIGTPESYRAAEDFFLP